MKISLKRLLEIQESCRVFGDKSKAANKCEDILIRKYWAEMPGTYSYADTVNRMIRWWYGYESPKVKA